MASELVEVHETQGHLELVQAMELGQEPAVDVGEAMDIRHVHAKLESLRNSPKPYRGGVAELLLHLLLQLRPRQCTDPSPFQLNLIARWVEAWACLVNHAQGLLDGLLEGSADGHDLTHALHGGADAGVHRGELLEVPAGHLGYHIVQRWLEAGSGASCHAVAKLRQVMAQRKLGSHVGQRIPRGLGGKGTAAREPGIHLDDAELRAFGIDRILDVAFAHDAQVPDDLQGTLPEPVVLLVVQRL
mmetsp:Transcript_132073/g.313033  ORF Transcript_132073/g.313033 Transcript_132073/m.313033 type:complete len:244 (-) Transcript_132073:2036-2767(-)